MTNSPEHCPFLNRTDDRCARHFSLSQLQHAFKFCFDQYADCPVYGELLAERVGRRSQARGRVYEPIVQVTISHRHLQRFAGAPRAAAASGV